MNDTLINVTGKAGISATVVQDSKSSRDGKRIVTFELEYPRFIHSEFMTHRLLSRNAASSRAIPISKLSDLVLKNPASPISWEKNARGMQSSSKLEPRLHIAASNIWQDISRQSVTAATKLSTIGVHKQFANRILEPYQLIKVVCTATEFDNFFYLRNHKDAQPEIRELARCMVEALDMSTPMSIGNNDWHVPYIGREIEEGVLYYFVNEDVSKPSLRRYVDRDVAVKISASCCAQISYRLADNSIDKATEIYDKLVNSKPVHASPFEHQATPITNLTNSCNSCDSWEKGVTHSDRNGDLWSANFRGWIQYRQLIDDHVCWNYGGPDEG